MIVISDCFTEKTDEGCIKVASNIAKKIKKGDPKHTLISYVRKSDFADMHMELNPLFINKDLIKFLKKKKESVLYIPFASNTLGSAIRTLILSMLSKKRVTVLFALRHPMNKVTKLFMKLSSANIVVLSQESHDFYKKNINQNIYLLKTGVDCEKFQPIIQERKNELRKKYKIPENKKIVLHVGHLKAGRNVDKLLNISDEYHVILVISSVTQSEVDLKNELLQRDNITIIDSFIENIEEIYQFADIYLFPVTEKENCIDLPLSVLEAAACNLPVVTTDYGELKSFKKNDGFVFINNVEKSELNAALCKAGTMTDIDTRNAVLTYDWKKSINELVAIVEGEIFE